MPEKDLETTKVLTEGDKVARFVASDDYQLVKGKFLKLIAEADSISTISPEDLEKQTTMLTIQIRAGAIALVRQWLAIVEGTAAQAIHNTNAMTENQKDDIIKRNE